MTFRDIAKIVANVSVCVAVGNFTTKALLANAPSTQKLHAAEIGGLAAGVVVSSKLEPQTGMVVDRVFDRFAKKN